MLFNLYAWPIYAYLVAIPVFWLFDASAMYFELAVNFLIVSLAVSGSAVFVCGIWNGLLGFSLRRRKP